MAALLPDFSGALSGMDQIDPKTMGLLSAAAAGLQASGPSRMPTSTGQVFGQALSAGLGGYGQGMQTQRQGLMMAAQLQELQKKQEQQKRIEAIAQNLPEKDRAAFLVDPAAFIKEQNKRYTVGNSLVTGTGEQVFNRPSEYTLSPGQTRFSGDQQLGALPAAPSLVNVPVPGKPGVEQPTWLRPGETAGTAVGGQKMPDILNPDVRNARKEVAAAGSPKVNVNTDSLGLKPKDRFDMEGKLRDDFRGNPTVKAASEMDSAFKLIETARNNPSPANDLAMATKYMKVLDPGSVVRESELALAVGAVGILDKVQNYASMVMSGRKLTPDQREDFYNSAKAINDTFQVEKEKVAAGFRENAGQYNLTPENVIGAPREAAPSTPTVAQPPKKGEVRKGWQFIGGDPSNRMNWKKAQ